MSAEPATVPEAAEEAGPALHEVGTAEAETVADDGAAGEATVGDEGTQDRALPGHAARVVTVGLSDAAQERLQAAGPFEPVQGSEHAAEAALAVVSTRAPLVEIRAALGTLRDAGLPVVALVHTGGESAAVEIMRAGGTGIVAEGNEAALQALLTGGAHDSGLVDSYERQQTRAGGYGDAARDRDPLTGLPGPAGFRQHLDELLQTDESPRVAFMRVLNLADGRTRLSPPADRLVRRRLAVQLAQLARAEGAELFALDSTDFGVLGRSLSPQGAETMGARMSLLAGSFAPSGAQPLQVVMGHAGAEVATDLPTLLELARRALDVAANDRAGAVVGADTLALDVSSTTELEAAVRTVAFVEQADPYAPGHGARVAELAGQLAAAVGYEGPTLRRIELAALLHDIGKVSLAAEAIRGPEGLEGELLEAYRSHPARGADYLRVSAGEEIAEAVRRHHERWDGAGFPDGLAGPEIPVAARIIAVADAVERLRLAGAVDADTLVDGLRELAGTQLDPDLVEPAVVVLAPADAEPARRSA